MLVITRLLGQSVFIGDDIEVTILSINGMQVRIGIAAPSETNIIREELLVEADNFAAVDSRSEDYIHRLDPKE
jgi:carbon storage regulator